MQACPRKINKANEKEKNPLILLLNIEMNSKKDKKSFLTSFLRVPEELYNYST